MPVLAWCICAINLLESASCLPENVHLIYEKCRASHHYSTRGEPESVARDLALSMAEPNISVVPHRISSDTVTVESLEAVLERKIPELVAPICEASTNIGSLFPITESEKLDCVGSGGRRRRSRLGEFPESVAASRASCPAAFF